MLNIDSLSKEFIMHIRGDVQIDGFQDISFSVEPGALVAITGPSGSDFHGRWGGGRDRSSLPSLLTGGEIC